MNELDRAVDGAALGPLERAEKTRLVLLAREAYERVAVSGQRSAVSFDEWRHQQVMMCVERPGLRECRHEDYGHVRAHFLRLLGRDAEADRADIRAEVEPRRMALHKLEAECAAAADVIDRPEGYVAAIARARFKADIEDLGEKQLWTLVFDIRRNAQRRRKKRGDFSQRTQRAQSGSGNGARRAAGKDSVYSVRSSEAASGRDMSDIPF